MSAARRNARVLSTTKLGHLAQGDPIRGWSEHAAAISEADVDELLRKFGAIALPLALNDGAIRSRRQGRCKATGEIAGGGSEHDDFGSPVAVCLLRLDHTPVVDVMVVRKGTVYDLTLEMRIEKWPTWADEC